MTFVSVHFIQLAEAVCFPTGKKARKQQNAYPFSRYLVPGLSKRGNYMSKMSNVESKYSASFIAAGLLYPEFLKLKEILESPDFEKRIEQEVEENALLRVKTRAARKRITQEIRKRQAVASNDFWAFFYEQPEAAQKLALFFLCLKAYPLIMDYHIEVTLKKWRSKSLTMDVFDLQMRLDEIASQDESVAAWSESTQRKTITVYLRILNEAGLLKKGKLTKPEKIAFDFWNYFIHRGEAWFIEACFLNKENI